MESTKAKYPNLLMVLLTTGVISSLITSIVTLVVSVNSNNTIERMETFKYNQALVSFRYERLLRVWEKVVGISRSTTLGDFAVVHMRNNDPDVMSSKIAPITSELLKLYHKSLPLFDRDLRDQIDQKARSFETLSFEQIPVLLGEEGHKRKEDAVLRVLDTMTDFIDVFKANLENQIGRLLVPVSK